VIQLLQALGAAHSAGIVHRDVKPQNIYLEESQELMDDGSRLRLLDFGIAWDTRVGAQNATPIVAGTPKYMAPEVGGTEPPFPHPTLDVYSAAVVAHEMLSGTAPTLDAEGRPVLLHTTERGREAGVSESLSRIISQALEPDPARRFPTGAQLLQALMDTQWEEETRLSPGEVIDDRYEVLACLGQGGMAVVYRAEDLRLGGQVAVKILQQLPGVTRDMVREHEGRFLSECEILTRLRHPNVVRILAVGQWASSAYCVLEVVEGSSLADKVSDMTWRQVLEALKGIAGALDAVHTEGVVHRDVTARNILIRTDGTAVLIDFGIARLGESWFTRTGFTVGTPGGEAPEQLVGEEITAATDQWALAALVYRQVTGQYPGEAGRGSCTEEQILQTMENVASGSIRPLETLRPDLPPAIIAAVSRGLASNPADRFRSCAQLVKDLQRASPAGFDPRVEAGLETRVEAGLETRVEAGLETRVEAGLETRVEAAKRRPERTGVFSKRLGWGLVGLLTLVGTILAGAWIFGQWFSFPAGRELVHPVVPAASPSSGESPRQAPVAAPSTVGGSREAALKGTASSSPRPNSTGVSHASMRSRRGPRVRPSRRPRSGPAFSGRRARSRPHPDLPPGVSVDPGDLLDKAKRLMKDAERAFCPPDMPDHPCHQRPR